MSKDKSKDKEWKLELLDYVAIVIAALETTLLPFVIITLIFFVIFLVVLLL